MSICSELANTVIIKLPIETLLWPTFLWNGLRTIFDYYEKRSRSDGKVNNCQEWS